MENDALQLDLSFDMEEFDDWELQYWLNKRVLFSRWGTSTAAVRAKYFCAR
jgi:hypothetical protein